MRRRDFCRGLAGTLGVAWTTSAKGLALQPGTGKDAKLHVDGARANRHLAELAAFGKNAEGGIDRVAYSEADRQARRYVSELMRAASLEAHVDLAGNLIGRRQGSERDRAPLMFGSHIDSVPRGGNYDGQVGSVGAIEVAHTLAEQGIVTRHPLEVVVFQNEENGKTGSRAISGEVRDEELDQVSHSRKTIAEGIAFLGGDPARLDEVVRHRGDVAAYLELHIEQGAILEAEERQIGVVEGIVGIRRWNVTFRGFRNHAGTTPMNQRRDALLASGRFIDAVHRVVVETPGRQVGTVGKIEAIPGAPNVIADEVHLTLEIRDLAMEKIDSVYENVASAGREIARATRTEVAFESYYVSRAAPTDPRLRDLVEESARDLGSSTLRLPSGAGHDAQSIALLAPAGMIFVPSVDGISHSPREYSRPEDIVAGINVLARSIVALDNMDL